MVVIAVNTYIYLTLFSLASVAMFSALIASVMNKNSITWLLSKLASSLFYLSAIFLIVNKPIVATIVALIAFSTSRLHLDVLKPRVARRNVLITYVALSTLILFHQFLLPLIDSEWVVYSSIILAIVLLLNTVKNIIGLKLVKKDTLVTDWPTVSILVPARNEDHALEEMLINLLALDYPKLEIIVLDDCSHDRTPQIISKFARDGVRFIPGTQPEENWIGKNNAMQNLLEESSGEYSIFCDVDVHLKHDSLNKLISEMITKKINFLSIVPTSRSFDLLPSLLPSLLDYWNIALSISFRFRSRVNGQIICVKTRSFIERGGISSASSRIVPEFILSKLFTSKETATILDRKLGVTTRKKLSSIMSTQVRNYYPLLGKNPIIVGVLSYSVFLIIFSFVTFSSVYVSLLFVGILVISYFIYIVTVNPANLLFGLVQLPILLILQMILMLVSMVGYELGLVKWKRRNVCYSNLETIAHLPTI